MKLPVQQYKFIGTIVRGFVIIVPLFAGVYLFRSLYLWIKENIQKVMNMTGMNSMLDIILAIIATVIFVILIAYIVGKISETRPIENLARTLDELLINNSEIYRNFKLKMDNNVQFLISDKPPVFVRFGDSERPGFLMEKPNTEGKCIVFIPKNFNTFNGNIYIVPENDIRYAKASGEDMIYAMDHLGTGMDIS